jgi:hypothetical protein
MRDQASDAIRHCAVEVLSMTAMVGTLFAVEPSQQVARDNPGSVLIALGLALLASFVALVLASRAIEHRNPDWRRDFLAHYDEPYEWVAAIAMFGVALVVAGLLALLTSSASALVLIVGGLYAGNLVRSLIIAGGKATQRS